MAGPIVCYHYPCPDGIYAAFAASFALGPETRFIPLAVFETESARTERLVALGDPSVDVYLCDFSGGPAFIRAIAGVFHRVILLDHHKTAQEDMAALVDPPANLEVNIDMARSGATMARDYFRLAALLDKAKHPHAAAIAEAFLLVEDNDLWRHALPQSKSFAAGFAGLALELDARKNPGVFGTLAGLDPAAIVAAGAAELEKQRAAVEVDVAAAVECRIPLQQRGVGGDVLLLRGLAAVTATPQYRSELGNVLASRAEAAGLDPVGIVIYEEAGLGEGAAAAAWKVSLRSLGAFDTTPFSRTYGGGGHRNASSFIADRAVVGAWLQPRAGGGPSASVPPVPVSPKC